MLTITTERAAKGKALFSGDMDIEGMDGVLSLYRDLFEMGDKESADSGPARELTDDEIQMRLSEGFTLLDLDELLPERDTLDSGVNSVIGILKKHSEDPDALNKDMAGIAGETSMMEDLARIYLSGGEEALRNKLLSVKGINPEVLIFVLFNTLKGSFLRAGSTWSNTDTSNWESGQCPVCGGEPAAAYLIGEGGRRYLICFRCETHWRFKRLTCPYCGKEDPEYSGYLYSEVPDYQNLSASVCSQCKSYIKVWRNTDDALGDLCPEIEDLKTPGFDKAVEEQGYMRGAPNIYGIWIGSLDEEGEHPG